MTTSEYLALSLKGKNRILKSVIRAANKDQKALMDRYRRLMRSKKTVV